jgi:GT2 family glycosyltransferase
MNSAGRRLPEQQVSSDAAAYAARLREVVKERDFMMFRPWRRASAEHEVTWKHRVLHTLARTYRRDVEQVAADLDAALEARKRDNRRKYAARLPARIARAARKVRRFLTWLLVLPLLRVKYVALPRVAPVRAAKAIRPRRERGAPPLASIVVLTHNRLDYVRTTLASLEATTAHADYELIVVDNGSRDGTADVLRGLADRGAIDKLVLNEENRGTSAGFNAGFAIADPSTRFLVKLDSDIIILTSGWLRRFAAFSARVPDVGLLALRQVNHLAHRLASPVTVTGERVISWNVSVAGGACMTIPRAVFDRIGYFREDFPVKYMPDDLDYALRVMLIGHRLFYLCGTLAYHRSDRNRHYAALEKQKRRERPESKERMRTIRQEYILGTHGLYVPYVRS